MHMPILFFVSLRILKFEGIIKRQKGKVMYLYKNGLAYASILFKYLSHILKVIAFISLIGFNGLACLIFLNSVYIFNVNFKMIMKQ